MESLRYLNVMVLDLPRVNAINAAQIFLGLPVLLHKSLRMFTSQLRVMNVIRTG